MSTPVPGVLSRRSHRRCMRIRCAPPVDSLSSHAASQEDLLRAEHDAPVHGHGRDQAVPGPADSLEGRQALAVKRWTSRLPGKHLPHLTGAEQNALYAGTAVEFTVKYGNVSALSPPPRLHRPPTRRTPIELRRCRFGCAILVLGRPVNLRPRRRPTLRRPARWRRLQRAGVLQNTPSDA